MESLERHEGEQMLKNVDRIFIFVEVDIEDTAVMLWFA